MNSQIINTLINTLALIVTLSLISGSVQGTGFDDPHQTPGVYSLDGVSMLGGGSQKSNNYDHKWLDNYLRDQYRIHVDGHIHGLSITKPESFQTNGEWNIQRVHRGKLFSWMSDRSLALDANGKPHIAYGQTHLYYARYDEEWHIETVDDSWDVGWYASLALDSDGYPHISYYDRDPNGDLKYAYKDENGWHITTVDDDGTVGLFTSIALDANNHPHISYFDDTNGNLKYAYWDGSEWLIQTIDSEGVVGVWRTSLAIGPNNFPHISYYDWINGNLKYAHWDGSEWQIVTVGNDMESTTVTDIDGNVYQTVKIGNQLWMAENLQVTKYRNGANIPTNLNLTQWRSTTSGAYAIYPHDDVEGINSDTEMVDAYGKLYNWYAVDDERGLCPTGWHVPTSGDWYILAGNLDGWSVAGGKMKSTRAEPDPHPRWNSPNEGATNESGFSGLPGGSRDLFAGFNFIGTWGGWWSSTEHITDTGYAWLYSLSYSSSKLFEPPDGIKPGGYSVRCIMSSGGTELGDDVGGYSSLAIDENGYPHISYLDYANGNLKYAYWDGTNWQIETVDSYGDVGLYTSLALDAHGNPHISYYDNSFGDLKYAFYNGNEWEIQRLTPDAVYDSPNEGSFTSIALDANDHPHISYVGQGPLVGARVGLRYTFYDGSEWQRDVVDYELEFSHTSLVVDNTNNPHIGYIKSDHRMGYTRWDGNQWHFESLRPAGNIVSHGGGSGSFLALDSDQRPHMIIQENKSYMSQYTPSFPSLIYTWYDGSTWQEKVLYSSSFNYQRNILSSSISIDNYDHPHICFSGYFGTPPSHSIFFRYMFRENNKWFESDIVKQRLGAGIDHSFVIDNDGLPQVSYRSSGLKYARPDESSWDIQLISDEAGYYNSIKTDANDLPHISYYDTTSTALKYAHWDGSEWQLDIVDNSGVVGLYTSLALDVNDFPHISYYDETNGNLKYAYWNGNQWQIETVDSYRTVGLYTSLALDVNGNPHISYYDNSFGDLKYATRGVPIIVKSTEEFPDKFVLFQNYPNPFNPSTTIRYDLPELRKVSIKVYNTLGQEVVRLSDEEVTAGTHEVIFDASHLPSGVYIYRLQAGEYVESKKMLYLK